MAPVDPDIILTQLREARALMAKDRSAVARKKHLANIDGLLDRYNRAKAAWAKQSV